VIETADMYKFYKVFASGKWKYCGTFDSTLDPEYHSYINWCRDNGIGWILIRTADNTVKYQG